MQRRIGELDSAASIYASEKVATKFDAMVVYAAEGAGHRMESFCRDPAGMTAFCACSAALSCARLGLVILVHWPVHVERR
jgi:hypothetical protein